jgi:hypothetical protein
MERLLLAAQEMGGPLNVVIGRMEYLLERGSNKEAPRSLNVIMPQAAYELYLARGGAGGDAAEDWFRAERELQARQP